MLPALAAGVFLVAALVLPGPGMGGAPGQTDLTVFRKDGASEAQQSQDRSECHLQAVHKVGMTPAEIAGKPLPPDPSAERSLRGASQQKQVDQVERWKLRTEYNRAVRACLEKRGYVLHEPGQGAAPSGQPLPAGISEPPPTEAGGGAPSAVAP